VEDGDLAVAFPDRRRRVHLHWIMMLDRGAVFGIDARWRVGQSLFDVARGLCWPHVTALFGRLVGVRTLLLQIGRVRLALVIDADARGGVARDLELLGDHQ